LQQGSWRWYQALDILVAAYREPVGRVGQVIEDVVRAEIGLSWLCPGGIGAGEPGRVPDLRDIADPLRSRRPGNPARGWNYPNNLGYRYALPA
jgi:hypothetical protein